MTTAPKSTSAEPDTKNYGRGKRESRKPQMGTVISHGDNSDDEIAIIEEKITPKTKMRLLHKKKIMANKGGGGVGGPEGVTGSDNGTIGRFENEQCLGLSDCDVELLHDVSNP